MLPQDPVILLSVVNTRLRDEYSDLEELCRSEGADGRSWRRGWPVWDTAMTRRKTNLLDH